MYNINDITPKGNANMPKNGSPLLQHINPKNDVAIPDIIAKIPDNNFLFSIINNPTKPNIKNGSINIKSINIAFQSEPGAINVAIKYNNKLKALIPRPII